VSTVDLEPIQSQLIQETTTSRPFSVADAAERSAGFLLLAAASPIIATSALAVAALSRRSPFVAHLRVGKDGTPFWMWKLRTMWPGHETAPARAGWVEYIVADPIQDAKNRSDPRVGGWFAALCRRHSIDELPQLWHVFRGEMSLVGPRPLTRLEVHRYYADKAGELLSVKPGLTGLWQVFGRSAIKFPQRAAMDLELVRTLKPRLYIQVLLRTIPAVIRGNGAW
jgi:lipopolysaccharide/colanic/teichoic acid biosynthesis glycosyltransferase